jgi:hypothetical protein
VSITDLADSAPVNSWGTGADAFRLAVVPSVSGLSKQVSSALQCSTPRMAVFCDSFKTSDGGALLRLDRPDV